MGTSKTFYLIDDDDDDRFLLKEAIHSVDKNILVLEWFSGAALLRDLKEADIPVPALIIVDMNMPAMNGLETIAAISLYPKVCSLPVVMISTAPSNYPLLLESQKNDLTYYRKPTSFEQYISLVEKLIQYC